ncbi:hypothetical protein IIC38_01365 [candidate division KSB1 bacterium]|nr:hypothetical protein [candidate division KSB1 bacterium]
MITYRGKFRQGKASIATPYSATTIFSGSLSKKNNEVKPYGINELYKLLATKDGFINVMDTLKVKGPAEFTRSMDAINIMLYFQLLEAVTNDTLRNVTIYRANGTPLGKTNQDGFASDITIAENDKEIIIGDGSQILPLYYAIVPNGATDSLGVLYAFDRDFPVRKVIKIQNDGIIDENAPNISAHLTDFSPEIVKNGIVPMKYFNADDSKFNELLALVKNINVHALKSTHGKYQIELPDMNTNWYHRTVNSIQDEVALRDSLKADLGTPFFYLFAKFGLANSSGANDNPLSSIGPHYATSGRIITTSLHPGTVFEEFITFIMLMQGETPDPKYEFTIFSGGPNTDSFPTLLNYRGRQIPVEEIMGAKFKFEAGTKLELFKASTPQSSR